ncbi:unnamed protein product [Mytilus edulis]|uniref:Endonuclease/exonuclease/phosphatase domain-containing protein n=1 Tax=Mytilus edulis TaxID=6550 RepID=A0A8S3VF09_MYTED|nr:unnamed protein product [Mytilus edulis]
MAETFLKTNERPAKLDDTYTWIGKCRNSGKDKGGIGICLKSDIPVLDDNVLNSKDDNHERLWVLSRIGNAKTAIGIAYFPNDGIDRDTTDKLMYELLENCSKLATSGYEILLMGDFNGKCIEKCQITNFNVMRDLASYNGKRLHQFIEAKILL